VTKANAKNVNRLLINVFNAPLLTIEAQFALNVQKDSSGIIQLVLLAPTVSHIV